METTTKRRWPWVVAFSFLVGLVGTGAALVIALILLAVVALAIIGGMLFVGAVLIFSPTYSGPEFVAALEVDKDQVAYSLLCPMLQESLPFEEFEQDLAPAKPVSRTEIEVTGKRSTFSATPLTYAVTYHFDDGSVGTATYVAEEGEGHLGKGLVCQVSPIELRN